jgi:type IV pilus assembly protein PilC
MPMVGDLLHKYYLAQSLFSMAVMLRGGMPLLTCLGDLSASAANPLLADGLKRAQQRVGEGESLSQAIKGTFLEMDLAAEMIQVGENTGALSDMLNHVATFYDEEVRTKLAALLSLVEPVLLVVMATIIGLLLFSMYYPLFTLLGRVGM